MKKKVLLPILLLATMVMTGCNNTPAKSNPSETPTSDVSQYGVAIANKEALQGEWYANTTRDIDVTLTPAANPLTELGKNLSVTSSDPEVVAVTGLGLKSLKAGKATITVKYHEATDTVEVTILDNSAKAKYGVAHEGTAEDPFTNEDALVVAKHEKYEGEVYYVKGIVDRFYNAPGSRTDGMVAYFLKAATEGGEQFEIYKCFKDGGAALTDDDIWVGGEATAFGAFTKYNDQYETSSATFVKCEGNKPQPRQTLAKTFAEVLAVGAALKDGESSWDYYKFQGYVTVKSGTDFYLTAAKGEALVPGKSDEAHGSKDIKGTNAIELYGAGKVEALNAKLLEGAKVEVTMIVKNYHGTIENGNTLADADITVVEAGTPWAVPEPAVSPKTLAEFIAAENTKAVAYNVTATVKSWKNATAEKDKYGNMILTDGTNDLVIYGASATATALAWDNSSAYAFTNPQDFLTNEVTKALNIGDEVTMKLIRADYNNTVQGTGIITKVTPAGAPVATLAVADSIAVGDKLIMSAEGEHAAQDGTKTPFKKQFNGIIASGNNKIGEAVDYSGDNPVSDTAVLEVVAGSSTGTFALKLGDKYLTWKSGNTLDQQDAVDANASWSFTFADGKATIANSGDAEGKRKLQYNSASPRFATYTSAQKPVTLWKITGGDTPVPAASYPTFKWSDAIQEGSAALDGAKFNKNATYNLKVENVPAAGKYTITLPMMGSDGNGAKTFNTTGTNHDGQGFTVLANDVEGKVLVAEKTYTEVFGADQKAWVDVLFGEVTLKEGSNVITIKTNNGGYRVSVKADGNVTLAEAVAEVAQPTGEFHGLAKTAAGGFIPVDMKLAADSAVLNINGAAVTVSSYTWDKKDTLTIVTDGAYGTITAKFADSVFTITGLTGAAASQLDLTYTPALSGNCQFLDCSVMDINAINATFLRRYDAGGGWTANTPDQNKMASVEVGGRKALKCNGYSGKIGLSLKNDFATPIPGTVIKSIGVWIYNSAETTFEITVYGYKGAGRTSAAELNKFTIQPGWHFYQTGVVNGGSFKTTDSLYNFQLYYSGVTSCDPVFDDFCLYM